MSTFHEVNQAKLSLKMTLSQYAWFHSIVVVSEEADYGVLVLVSGLNDGIRKIVPTFWQGVDIRLNNAK